MVPRTVVQVIDRSIQLHGAAGISDATPLSKLYGWHRAMRIFDGPDEVHLASLGRHELTRAPLVVDPTKPCSPSGRPPRAARSCARAACSRSAEVAGPVAGRAASWCWTCGACGIRRLRPARRDHCDELADAAAGAGYDGIMRSTEAVVLGHEFCGEVVEKWPGTRAQPGTAVVAMPIVRAPATPCTSPGSPQAPGGYAEQAARCRRR